MADTTRVQLELPPRSFERLKRVKETTEAASYAEVFKNAIRLYEAMIKESQGGAKFFIKRGGSATVVPYPVFLTD
jgi:hypothetical protein